MKRILFSLFLLGGFWTNGVFASSVYDLVEDRRNTYLKEFVKSGNVEDLYDLLVGLDLRNKANLLNMPEGLLEKATDTLLSPLEAETNLDLLAQYPYSASRIMYAMVFCARLKPSLSLEQKNKLLGACELYEAVEKHKLVGIHIFNRNKRASFDWSIQAIMAHYHVKIPQDIRADYMESDIVSRFAINMGYFISQACSDYQRSPRLTTTLYLVSFIYVITIVETARRNLF